jgi:hypothetical protein
VDESRLFTSLALAQRNLGYFCAFRAFANVWGLVLKRITCRDWQLERLDCFRIAPSIRALEQRRYSTLDQSGRLMLSTNTLLHTEVRAGFKL